MNGQLNTLTIQPEILERLVTQGDCAVLSSQQRVDYYTYRCRAMGLDPATQPFEYLKLNGKLVLYAKAAAAQQLSKSRNLSVEIVSQSKVDDLFVVHARVKGADGRSTDNIGATTIGNLKGDALANAMLKAVTKAQRRAIFAHEGLGMLDETEIETIPLDAIAAEVRPSDAPEPVNNSLQNDDGSWIWTDEDKGKLYDALDVLDALVDSDRLGEISAKALGAMKDGEEPRKVLNRLDATTRKAQKEKAHV